ncbi:MAG: cytochrome c oxidase subunit II [Pseudomonadota bacterium]
MGMFLERITAANHRAQARMGDMALRAGLGAAALIASAGAAGAQSIGQSEPGQLNLQEPATQVARQVYDLHNFMLVIITGITIFVLALLVIVILRYNSVANKEPATWTHNTPIEVTWTLAPVVILVIIAIPSVQLLLKQEDFSKVEPDIVIKTTGHQWYWSYEYPEQELEFDSFMLGSGEAQMSAEVEAELAEYGYPPRAWKLATDTAVVVPVNKTVLVQVTAGDVIHAWAVPAFGVKADGVPGRVNQTWFNAEKEGVFFGQCSELCGKDHSFMPITVKVVSQEVYDEWVACSQANDVSDCPTPTMFEILEAQERVAAAEAAAETRLADATTEPR